MLFGDMLILASASLILHKYLRLGILLHSSISLIIICWYPLWWLSDALIPGKHYFWMCLLTAFLEEINTWIGEVSKAEDLPQWVGITHSLRAQTEPKEGGRVNSTFCLSYSVHLLKHWHSWFLGLCIWT